MVSHRFSNHIVVYKQHPTFDPGSGFTLIEVVVGLLIIATVVSVVFETFSTSRRLSIKADKRLEAVRVLHNVINNRVVIEQILDSRKENDQRSGIVAGDPGWAYSLRSQPLRLIEDQGRDPLEMNAMVDVEVCVFPDSDSGSNMYCVHRWFRSDDLVRSTKNVFGPSATQRVRKR